MEEKYNEESKMVRFSEGDDAVSSRIDFGGKKSKMVGFSKQVGRIMYLLSPSHTILKVITLVGMAGIGKTTLAKKIYEDSFNRSCVEYRAWVKVGPECELEQIVQDILAQIDSGSDKTLMKGDEKEALSEILNDSSYLIVLDDIWSSEVWKNLRYLFGYNNRQGRVLLTTALHQVAKSASIEDYIIEMPFLDNEESWCLLRQEVFGEKPCPRELEKAGKKIAENCEGLPLTIVTVADILSEADKTPEHWNKVAEKQNSVFMDAYDRVSKVLSPSYEHLPEYLNPFFLYMGAFPQGREIPSSKLITLWSAEGFLIPNSSKALADLALEYLEELNSRSLVMICQQGSSLRIKTCRLHSAFWYLCNRKAVESKFFKALNSHADCSGEGIENQHRLSIHNNVLLGIKDVHDSLESISTVRSLLCFGPYHQYQVSICSYLSLLRVLEALSIRFYEFPMEVLKLDQLRYLALTCNGDLPATISILKNLQFLIVRRHPSIKYCGAPSYLPREIWDMKELKHLQVTGSNLPDPKGDAPLPNLLTLLDVSAHSCTKSVIERIPNLEKLGIQIELVPDSAEQPSFSCFDHISLLKKLKSLKCVIVNPILKSELGTPPPPPPPPLPNFPPGLKKLTLSGIGYSWEEMHKIASSSSLEVLKLRCYAFQGQKWEAHDGKFSSLKYLLIEDTDLADWTPASGSFFHIRRIIIKNCYRLKDIPLRFWNNVPVDLVDCNPLAATFKQQHYCPLHYRKVRAKYSW